jgi:hypothetical protein
MGMYEANYDNKYSRPCLIVKFFPCHFFNSDNMSVRVKQRSASMAALAVSMVLA